MTDADSQRSGAYMPNRRPPSLAAGPFVTWLDMPDARLSPNARTHWRVKAKLVKAARTAAFVSVIETLGPRSLRLCCWHAVTIKVSFHVSSRRRRDIRNMDSNCGLKAYIDGFVDAGLMIDDDRITWLPSEIVHEKGCDVPVVKIEVWPEMKGKQ